MDGELQYEKRREVQEAEHDDLELLGEATGVPNNFKILEQKNGGQDLYSNIQIVWLQLRYSTFTIFNCCKKK